MTADPVTASAGEMVRFEIRQHRFQPLARWSTLAGATALALLAAWRVLPLLPAHPVAHVGSVLVGIALFVALLATLAGGFTALPHALLKRGRVAFTVRPFGIDIEAPARRGTPSSIHRDEIAGPFVRIDEAIDAEASAATMMRLGGEEMATALAEGARATGGSADTLLWFLFSGCAGSVIVIYRGYTVVLAEALSGREAEDVAHRIEMALRG